MCSGLGPTQMMLCDFDDLGELGVLGQKAVAWVDRVGVDDLGRRDDVRYVEVGFDRWRRPDADGFVGETDVHRVGIGGRMNRDRSNPHFVTCAVDPKGNLAAVGDQKLLDVRHCFSQPITTSG